MKTNKDLRPLYLKIYQLLKKQIEEGKLANGEIIPSEYQLAKDFKVSRVTMRATLGRLQKENYIMRKRGYGTEVIYSPEKIRDKNSIAVIVVDILRPFFSEIIKGIQAKLDKEKYKLILCDSENSSEKERDYIIRYKDIVAGFIIAPTTGNQNHAYYGQLLTEKVPFVFIDRYLSEFNVDAVVSDNTQGGYIAVKYLLELGHRKIAFLGEPAATSLIDRIEGYKKALLEFGIKPKDEYILFGEKRGFEAGYSLADKIMNEFPEVTAALCANDDIACGLIKAMAERGIKLPEGFSIIGYDNIPFLFSPHPSLTTIEQQKHKMGEKAAEFIIERIEGKYKEKKKIVYLPVKLIKKDSAIKIKSKRKKDIEIPALNKYKEVSVVFNKGEKNSAI